MFLYCAGVYNVPTETQVLDTEYFIGIPCEASRRAHIMEISFNASGTAQVLTVMNPLIKSKVASDAAAAQNDVVLDDATGYATDDRVAFRLPSGEWWYSSVASVDTNTLTLNDAVPTGGISANAAARSLGVPTDPGHAAILATAASGDTVFYDNSGIGRFVNEGKGEPMIVHCTNATAQIKFTGGRVAYSGAPRG